MFSYVDSLLVFLCPSDILYGYKFGIDWKNFFDEYALQRHLLWHFFSHTKPFPTIFTIKPIKLNFSLFAPCPPSAHAVPSLGGAFPPWVHGEIFPIFQVHLKCQLVDEDFYDVAEFLNISIVLDSMDFHPQLRRYLSF